MSRVPEVLGAEMADVEELLCSAWVSDPGLFISVWRSRREAILGRVLRGWWAKGTKAASITSSRFSTVMWF